MKQVLTTPPDIMPQSVIEIIQFMRSKFKEITPDYITWSYTDENNSRFDYIFDLFITK